jgi:DNA-binding beta-propeller fold protein YncE
MISFASAQPFFTRVLLLNFLLVVAGPLAAVESLQRKVIWRYHAPSGACEIASFSAATGQIFITVADGIDIVAAQSGERLAGIAVPADYHPTSVACMGDVVAVAWAAVDKHNRGRITFYNAQTLAEIASYDAGYLPDMITFTPAGQQLLVANEGEPTTDYSFDPEASITIIAAQGDGKHADAWQHAETHEATFTKFNAARADLIKAGLHIFGPSKVDPDGLATVAQDVEPEYIAVSGDSQTAWITLQENNAIAQLDITAGEIVAIHPLGMKSFCFPGQSNQARCSSPGIGLDVNDTDGPCIKPWPIWGMYQPDGIATFRAAGHDYLVTANEGDPRDYYDFLEVVRIGDLATQNIAVDPENPARLLTADHQLGRLGISRYAGDTDHDGDLDRFVVPGTRSFAIWRVVGDELELVFDSGSDFECIIAKEMPNRFNADSSPDSPPDIRSPLRGPEPENIALLEVEGRRIVAIGLERTGGAMLYDVSQPRKPAFLSYLPPHEADGVLDLAPEGLLAIPAEKSPTGKPLLILCNEGSGTMTAWEVAGCR